MLNFEIDPDPDNLNAIDAIDLIDRASGSKKRQRTQLNPQDLGTLIGLLGALQKDTLDWNAAPTSASTSSTSSSSAAASVAPASASSSAAMSSASVASASSSPAMTSASAASSASRKRGFNINNDLNFDFFRLLCEKSDLPENPFPKSLTPGFSAARASAAQQSSVASSRQPDAFDAEIATLVAQEKARKEAIARLTLAGDWPRPSTRFDFVGDLPINNKKVDFLINSGVPKAKAAL